MKKGDAIRFSLEIDNLLNNNEYAEKISKNGYDHVQSYDFKHITSMYDQLFKQIEKR